MPAASVRRTRQLELSKAEHRCCWWWLPALSDTTSICRIVRVVATLLWTQRQFRSPSALGLLDDLRRCARARRDVRRPCRRSALRRHVDMGRSDWTQVADIGPAPRSVHAMAFDATRTRVVLFGGRTEDALAGYVGMGRRELDADLERRTARRAARPGVLAGTRSRHFWRFRREATSCLVIPGSGTATTGRGRNTGPAPRRLHATTVDDVRGRLIVMGGLGGSPEQELADTWEWNGTAGVQEAAFGPGPIFAAAMAPGRRRVFLFGGAHRGPADAAPATMADVGVGRPLRTLRQDIGPSRRAGHAMTFDRGRAQVVLFGGTAEIAPAGTAALGDTWTLPEEIQSPRACGSRRRRLRPRRSQSPSPLVPRFGDTVSMHFATAPLLVTQALMLTCSVPDLGRTPLKPVSVPRR